MDLREIVIFYGENGWRKVGTIGDATAPALSFLSKYSLEIWLILSDSGVVG